MIEITYPWPDRDLHPNARVHWAVRSKAAASAREQAALMLKATRQHFTVRLPPDGPLELWLDFFPPNRRKHDDDGLVAAFKPWRDGLADALGIDDARFQLHVRVRRDQVRKGGAVQVAITEPHPWAVPA